MRTLVRFAVPVWLSVGVLAVLSLGQAGARTAAERLTNGAKIFASSCTMCHGDRGMGDGPLSRELTKESGAAPARLNDPGRLAALGREGVRKIIVEGGGHRNRSNLMPAWGDRLSPSQADDVTDYVMSLPSQTMTTPQSTLDNYTKAPAGAPEEGRKLFVYYCSGCHGLSGRGDGVYAKTLRARHKVWPRNLTQTTYFANMTDQQLYVVVALGGGHVRKSSMMPSWTVTLSPPQIKHLVSYIRAISKTKPRP